MLTAKFFDIVEFYRIRRNRNMWSDMLEMDLIFIICGWDQEEDYDE